MLQLIFAKRLVYILILMTLCKDTWSHDLMVLSLITCLGMIGAWAVFNFNMVWKHSWKLCQKLKSHGIYLQIQLSLTHNLSFMWQGTCKYFLMLYQHTTYFLCDTSLKTTKLFVSSNTVDSKFFLKIRLNNP